MTGREIEAKSGRAATGILAVACVGGVALAAALALPVPPPALAETRAKNADAPRFSLPIACDPGVSCFIQSHVDLDASPAAHDFRCGTATYDGHKGVDFRLLSTAAARAGVSVRAAADGIVRRTRDGMQDAFVTPSTMAKIRPRGCGNSVVIDHGHGWRTAYCHMRKGSVRVRSGTRVKRGEAVGEVGYSGLVEFSHLHFMVMHDGKVVDPESGLRVGEPCRAGGGAEASGSLWDDAARQAFPYRNGEIIGAGFSARPPATARLELDHRMPPPGPEAEALLFYARLINLRKGDRITLAVRGPAAFALQSTTKPLDREKATYVAYLGRKLKAARWPPGRYEGTVRLIRDGKDIALREGVPLDLP